MRKVFSMTLVLILLFVPQARAQIFVEQGKVIHQITRGQKITGSVPVHNTSNEPVAVKAYWEDFRYEPPFDGSKKFFPPGTTERSLSQWISFFPQQFTLPPYGKQEISYVINTPGDVQGGYYGVLFFEREAQSAHSSTGVRIVTRVGSLFFLETLDRVKRAAITDIASQNGTFSARLENTGNVILIPAATFYVMNRENFVVDRGEINTLYLPPGEKGSFSFNLRDDLAAGGYTIILTFDLKDGHVLVKEIDFQKELPASYSITGIRD